MSISKFIKGVKGDEQKVEDFIKDSIDKLTQVEETVESTLQKVESNSLDTTLTKSLSDVGLQLSETFADSQRSLIDKSTTVSSSLVQQIENQTTIVDPDKVSEGLLERLNEKIEDVNYDISRAKNIVEQLEANNIPRGLQNSLENFDQVAFNDTMQSDIVPNNQTNGLSNSVGNLVKPVKSITEQISALEQKLAKQSITPQAKSIGTYVFNANRSAYDVVTSASPSLGNDPTDILIKYTRNLLTTQFPEKLIRQLYEQLYHEYQPDITGHTILLMVPPDLSGYRIKQPNAYGIEGDISEIMNIANFIPFAAVDFSLPTYQVNAESVESRSGGVPYATEVVPTNQMSVTYIENSNLDIYNLHSLWIKYIWGVTAGLIKPDSRYIDKNSSLFRAVDYVASFYVLKFDPSLTKIMYAGKAVGCFPQSLPNKELIGNRSSNELTTLPFTYYCSGYYEATAIDGNNWIFKEIASFFQ